MDPAGNVTAVVNFEPADGSVDGPYGDIVYLTEGPDGALYYLDLGYSDIGAHVRRQQAPADPLRRREPGAGRDRHGQPPRRGRLRSPSAFSSAGSIDPEGQPLTYSWTFGDGTTSVAANPVHTYTAAGSVHGAAHGLGRGQHHRVDAHRRSASGTCPPRRILSPTDGAFFIAGDVISFSGDAVDAEDGTLPRRRFTWNIDFLHGGHVHPGTPRAA